MDLRHATFFFAPTGLCLNKRCEEKVGMMKRLVCLAMFMLSGMFALLHAESESASLKNTVYVDCNYYGDQTGGFFTPYQKIQDGIDNVASNGVVVVAPGTYYESLMLTNHPVRLIASGCATNTTIITSLIWFQKDAKKIFVSSSASGSVISGFSVVGTYTNPVEDNGHSAYGRKILCEGSVEIRDCIITGDESIGYVYGGGIYVSGNGIEVKAVNCLFKFNNSSKTISFRLCC